MEDLKKKSEKFRKKLIIFAKKKLEKTIRRYSISDYSFIVADKSVGMEGFRISWTEVSVAPSICKEFKCEKSSYCIPGKLRCNNISNCGENDMSDEQNCT